MIHHGSIVEGHPKLTPARRKALRALDHVFTAAALGAHGSGGIFALSGLCWLGSKVVETPSPAWANASWWLGTTALASGGALVGIWLLTELGKVAQEKVTAALHAGER